MPAGIRSGFFALWAVLLGAVLLAAFPATANSPTFADLLAKAKAQASAGHRWTPPGDNMTETIMQMMELVPTATAAQLGDLGALLESDKGAPPPTAYKKPPDASASTEPLTQPKTDQPPAEPGAKPGMDQGVTDPGSGPAVNHDGSGPDTAASEDHKPSESASKTLDGFPTSPPAPPTTATASLPSPIAPAPSPGAPPGPSPGLAIPPFPAPPATPSAKSEHPDVAAPAKVLPSPGPRANSLFTRGLDAEHQGDFSAARRFYLSAAEQGNAAAARNLGRLYDPAYLKHTALGGVDPDPALARQWYERALKLGDSQAGPLLEAISQR